MRAGPEQLQRGAAPAAGDHARLAGAGSGGADGLPRLLLAGTNCDYVAPFIGSAPFFLEVNARMPRTFGRNQIHVSQVAGWTEVDRPLVEVAPPQPGAVDQRIAGDAVERIPDGATIQAGIGSIPHALLRGLHGHHDLGCTPSCSRMR